MNKPWQVMEFSKARFDDVEVLRDSFVDKNKKTNRRSYNHDYFHWKLRQNPYNKGLCKVIEAEGKTVGMTTITPKRLKISKQIENGAEIGDTSVSYTHLTLPTKRIV